MFLDSTGADVAQVLRARFSSIAVTKAMEEHEVLEGMRIEDRCWTLWEHRYKCFQSAHVDTTAVNSPHTQTNITSNASDNGDGEPWLDNI